MSAGAADLLSALAASGTGSSNSFRELIDALPVAVYLTDAEGRLAYFNAAARRLFGRALTLGVDKWSEAWKVLLPDGTPLPHEKCPMALALNGLEPPVGLELMAERPDGTRIRYTPSSAPLRDATGRLVGAINIISELSDRRPANRAAPLLSAIVDSSDDAIISKDLDGVVMSWNKSAERLFGYAAEEAMGKSVAELIVPEDRQQEESEILARLRRGERIDHFETVRRRKDGALLEVSLTISPVRDAEGRIIGASKIARDISDRKRVDRAIEILNMQLTADLAAMTRIQELSTRPSRADALMHLLGEIVTAAVEITCADMGDIQLLEDGIPAIVAQRGFDARFVNFVNRINKTNAVFAAAIHRGERIIVEDVATSPFFAGQPALSVMLGAGVRAMQLTPLITRGGRALGMLSTHYRTPRRPSDRDLRLIDIIARQTADLTERHHAEMALLVSERRFRQLADAMPALVWTATADGYVDYYNERWYEFTGLSRDQFGNESWEPTLHPEDLQKTRDAWSAAIRSGTAYDLEYRLWDRKQNRWRWFVGRALPVRDARGSVVKWFGSCTDIDEQKSVQAELERANEDLEQFAFSASHDLQEPLRAIKIYSELLARRLGEHLDSEAREYLSFLLTGASRMEDLIRDLLAYTRASNFEPPANMTDANEALQAALTDLTHAIQETGARVSADPLPPVRVHYTHLHQIFQNLIGNALKYRSPERRPEVHIGGECRDGSCIFAVGDNGIGIAPEYRESIFGLFKRLHTSDQYSGTGIGLAICQRIVGRYHGRIWVESQPGHGSTFRFELPL